MKAFLLVVLFSLATVFVSSWLSRPQVSYAADWGFLVGTVYDASTGAVLPKATVTAVGNGYTVTKTTNQYGLYGLSLPVQGTYSVTFSKRKYVPQTIEMYAGPTGIPADIHLVPTR